jgi:hypothetical protein
MNTSRANIRSDTYPPKPGIFETGFRVFRPGVYPGWSAESTFGIESRKGIPSSIGRRSLLQTAALTAGAVDPKAGFGRTARKAQHLGR